MKDIIVLGGTFNPIHNGHLMLAAKAYETLGIPVIIMPSGDPSSYKSGNDIITSAHRCKMVEAAIKDYNFISISYLEVNRPGKTYTADTLKILKEEYNTIYFIIGADSFFALPTWYKPEFICANCQLLVAGRDDHSDDEMNQQKELIENSYNGTVKFLNTPPMPYSSTQIRHSIRNGSAISNFVPEGVAKYIYDNRLYTE